MAFRGSVNGDHVPWRLEGPQNIGGRINCIALNQQNQNSIYVGNAAGGIFKTTNGGNDWVPISDDFDYLPIGAIAINPSDTNILYAGTGDPNISGLPHIGNGVYKSVDGGANWTHQGLSNQRIISRLLIDYDHPDTIYAATMGNPFERDSLRGLYKSVDGGKRGRNRCSFLHKLVLPI